MKKNINLEKWIGVFVLITLIFSVGYSIVKIVITPEVIETADVSTHVRSDYVLMLLQCILGLVVMSIPSMVEKKWKIDIPNYTAITYYIFLYCSIYLGDVRNFYYIIPHWDTILHCFSGAMLGALGFSLVRILNDSERIHVVMSPIFICLFALCFAVTAGVVWETYEFLGDSILGLNMQKYRLVDGTVLVGQDALYDTMIDLIVDTLGALVVVIVGFISMKGKEIYRKRKQRKN